MKKRLMVFAVGLSVLLVPGAANSQKGDKPGADSRSGPPAPPLIPESNHTMACRNPALAIPDSGMVTDTLTIPAGHVIGDLEVLLNVTHTFVGDLSFTLQHQSSGTSATIVDRPGVPASTFGCGGDDIAAVIDDQASADVESRCNPVPPAVGGSLVGGDPPNPALLGAFNGLNSTGTWTLTISDNAGIDVGTLDQWCVNVLAPVPTLGTWWALVLTGLLLATGALMIQRRQMARS